MEARIFNNIMTPISLRPFKIIDGTFLDQENFKKEFKDKIYNPKLKLC